MSSSATPSAGARAGWKAAADYGPLVGFFTAYFLADLMVATGVLVALTLLAIPVLIKLEGKLPWTPIVTATVVALFGGLTLWLHDETFIKLKPTIVSLGIAAILFGGLVFGKPLLKPVMGAAWPMKEEGWRKLTLRFAFFFVATAAANEIVWRTQSTDLWVSFKVFGITLATIAFTLTQIPLMTKYQLPLEGEEAKK
jgi:intracellular septation protein